jgi:hypothetical protein
MAVKIALGPRPQPASGTSAPPGIRLNLPIRLGSGAPSTLTDGRKTAVLNAVAAAVALKMPGNALETAKDIRDEPQKAIPSWWDKDLPADLSDLLDHVNTYQADRTNAPTASTLQQAVAREVDADPVLVAAAAEFLDDKENAVSDATAWVAMIDSQVLDRAARAAAKARGFSYVPSPIVLVEDLGKRVQKLETDVVDIKRRLKKGGPPQPKERAGGGQTSP